MTNKPELYSQVSRRDFSKSLVAGAALSTFAGRSVFAQDQPIFKISLAQWSLNKSLFGKKLDNLDFASYTKTNFDIDAVEYVNQFFKDKANDAKYIAEMKKRASDAGVKNLLIMCDGEGKLGDKTLAKRAQAVENHFKWVEAAKELGCYAIRVNAASSGSYVDQVHRAADGLRSLSEFADPHGIDVIVENHGGLSSNGAWLAEVITKADHPRCGTLPDFGNFRIGNGKEYNRYQGVIELMPFAKAVSAKSHSFDEHGNEKSTDFLRMMKIVLAAGYHGHVGIEYEGNEVGENEGIKLTKQLLERVREQLS